MTLSPIDCGSVCPHVQMGKSSRRSTPRSLKRADDDLLGRRHDSCLKDFDLTLAGLGRDHWPGSFGYLLANHARQAVVVD